MLPSPLESVVLAEEVGSAFRYLHATSRLNVFIALVDESRPVLNRSSKSAGMDEIKMVLGERPL